MIYACTRVALRGDTRWSARSITVETDQEIWIPHSHTLTKRQLAKCRHTGSYKIGRNIVATLLYLVPAVICWLFWDQIAKDYGAGVSILALLIYGTIALAFIVDAGRHLWFAYKQIRIKQTRTDDIEIVPTPNNFFDGVRDSFKSKLAQSSSQAYASTAWGYIVTALRDTATLGQSIDQLLTEHYSETAEWREALALPGGDSTKYTSTLQRQIRESTDHTASKLADLYRTHEQKQIQAATLAASRAKDDADQQQKIEQEKADLIATEQTRIAEMRAEAALGIIESIQ